MSLLGFLLFALSLLVVVYEQTVISSVMQEKLTQALHRQHIQGALTGLDQVCQPGHGLRGRLRAIENVSQLGQRLQSKLCFLYMFTSVPTHYLSLDDVEEEVRAAAAAQQMSQVQRLVQAFYLLLDLRRRTARRTPESKIKTRNGSLSNHQLESLII